MNTYTFVCCVALDSDVGPKRGTQLRVLAWYDKRNWGFSNRLLLDHLREVGENPSDVID